MQKYKVQYSIESVAQIKRITNWYKEINRELGNRFATNLKQAINTLKDNPFNASFRYDNVRYAVANKFPYAASLYSKQRRILSYIHAVFAFQENPEKWVTDLE
jgi:basic membrane lipoprotein Med (substrate-binding protein (PBP1-ABC) superfamily)